MVAQQYMTREERAQKLLENPKIQILRINDNHYQLKTLQLVEFMKSSQLSLDGSVHVQTMCIERSLANIPLLFK